MVNRRQLLKISALGTASFAAPLAYSASNTTMAYNTGNAIGSTSPKDLSDNARNLDHLVNGSEASYLDRKGVPRRSWKGMEGEHNADQARREIEFDADQGNREVEFTAFMDASGFEPPVPYAAGIVLSRTTQTVTYLGNEYRAKGVFIPLTLTNWAVDEARLKLIGDDSLRQNLADPSNGPEMLAYSRSDGVPQTFGILVKGTDPKIWEWERYVIKPTTDPATWQWGAAAQACLEQVGDLIFPNGIFKMEREIDLPSGDSRVSVKGAGVNTQLVSLLENSGSYLFNSAQAIQFEMKDFRFATPWDEDIRNKDVGLIETEGTLRGTTLKGLYVAGIYRGIHLGRQTWGRTTIQDYNQILLDTDDPAVTLACGIFIEGNTVFMRDIEILGRFDKGLKIVGSDAVRCEVITLDEFNISGASSASTMRTAIYTENVNNFTARAGWIEQTYNLPTETHGLGETVTMFKGSANCVENVWVASQSIYVGEQYDTHFDRVRFGSANAGIQRLGEYNNEITAINTEQWATAGEDVYNNERVIYGKVTMLDEAKYHRAKEGKSNNPYFSTSYPAPTSNDPALVTVTPNTTDYLTGIRAFDVVTTSATHGVHFELSGLVPNANYTFVVVAKIPAASAITTLRFMANNPNYGTAVFGFPSTRIKARDSFQKMYSFMKADSSGRIFVAFGGDVAGTFRIDSFQAWTGYRTDAPH